MKVFETLCRTGITTVILLLVTSTQSWAFTAFSGNSGFGGESRGLTAVGGRVVCARCDLEDMQRSQPTLPGLYELQHRQGQIVMQLLRPEDASAAAWWEAIVGLDHTVSVRTPDRVFAQLMAEENLNRRVGIQGLLRPTRTYDVVNVRFLEDIRRPLSAAPATNRAEAAAVQAEGAVVRAERAAGRLEAAAKNAEAQFEERLRK